MNITPERTAQSGNPDRCFGLRKDQMREHGTRIIHNVRVSEATKDLLLSKRLNRVPVTRSPAWYAAEVSALAAGNPEAV